jgi:hypothetical protein
MKRREFITLIGGAAATWPLVARRADRGYGLDRFQGAKAEKVMTVSSTSPSDPRRPHRSKQKAAPSGRPLQSHDAVFFCTRAIGYYRALNCCASLSSAHLR